MSLGVEDLDQILGQFQRPTPEALAAAQAFAVREHDEMIRSRRQLWYWACLVCTCSRWWDWDNMAPPQLGCPLHGHRQLMGDGVLR